MNAALKHDRAIDAAKEMERAVLGAILIDNQAFHFAREHVTDADFFALAHRLVFRVITRLLDAGEPVDLAVVQAKLTDEELDEVGLSYLSSLVDGVPKATNVSYYARQVASYSALRALAQASLRIHARAQDFEDDADTILTEAQTAIQDIRNRRSFIDARTPEQRASATYKQLDEILSGGGFMRGVSTGLPKLDAYLRGLHAGNLITIGARPSQGKTALMLHLAIAASTCERPALVFSLEMSEPELNLREATTRANVNSWRLLNGSVSECEQRRLMTAIEDMQQGAIRLVDAPHLTIGRICSHSWQMKARHDLSLITIDYLQLIMPDHRRGQRTDNRSYELGEMSRSLKQLARDLEVPVVLLSQLSRQPEARFDKKPQLADLRESGSIEQDSDVVLLLYRPNAYPELRAQMKYEDHYAEIIIAKQRNGPTGSVRAAFYREQTRWANWNEAGQTTAQAVQCQSRKSPVLTETSNG